MQDGLRIGRIGPTPLYLSRTWPIGVLLLAALYVSSVSAYLPLERAVPIAAALVAGLFLSVLIHEVSHGLAGRATGRPADHYTLTLWGGYTAFTRTERNPAIMAFTALAGPAANFVLAGLLHVLAATQSGDIGAIVSMLATMNLALGVFNLAPGLPMDGGHVVHAVAWAIVKDRDRGMLAGAWAGRVIALLIGAGALVRLVLERAESIASPALWLLIIALFLWQGASTSLAVAKARIAAAGVDLRRLMMPVPALDQDAPATQIPPNGAVVLEGDKVIGIVPPLAQRPPEGVPVSAFVRTIDPRSVLTLATGADAVAALGSAARQGDVVVLPDPPRWYLGHLHEMARRLPVP